LVLTGSSAGSSKQAEVSNWTSTYFSVSLFQEVTVRRSVGLDCLDDFLGLVTSASRHCNAEVGLPSLGRVLSSSLDQWQSSAFSPAFGFSRVIAFVDIELSPLSFNTTGPSSLAHARSNEGGRGLVLVLTGSSAGSSKQAEVSNWTSTYFSVSLFQEVTVRRSVGLDCLDDFLGLVTSASRHCKAEAGLLSLGRALSSSLDQWQPSAFSPAFGYSRGLAFIEIKLSPFSFDTTASSIWALACSKEGRSCLAFVSTR